MSYETKRLSLRELFSKTLSIDHLKALGLNKDEICELLLHGARQRKISIKELRSGRNGLYIQRDKLLAFVSSEQREEVATLIGKKYKVAVTNKLLCTANLQLVDIIEHVNNIDILAESLFLESTDILKLDPKAQHKNPDHKCITLAYVSTEDKRAGIRAQRCNFMHRCIQIAARDLKDQYEPPLFLFGVQTL